MLLFQVRGALRPFGLLPATEHDVCLAGVLLSLNIRLDYLKNVPPFSTDSYFVYSCIGPHLYPSMLYW